MRFCLVPLMVMVVAVTGCKMHHKQNLPPAERLMEPGPGVGGPGPGIMTYQPNGPAFGATSQLLFAGPAGMQVAWDVGAPGMFDSSPLVCPGRYDFPQGAIYRLKIWNLGPGREDVELFPTIEVGPALPRTEAFLAHNAIPVAFSAEDFDQVLTGNFVTKVIYLPDPEFQELALAGVETLVSTRLDPGVDPIVEADRRGAILAIVRLGNKDLRMPAEMIPGGEVSEVTQAAYQCPIDGQGCPNGGGAPIPLGMPMYGYGPPTGYIAGMTGPQYGMPMCGTPIGLAGPPHVPLGVQAGLQYHTITNHTRMHMPGPEKRVKIDVKQKPGFSYPKPANHARIVEKTNKGPGTFHQPMRDKRERIVSPNGDPSARIPCENGAAGE
jgi:hypothetical protein